jgi:hypothetical protein
MTDDKRPRKSAQVRRWKKENREKHSAQLRRYRIKRRSLDPDWERNNDLKKKYGITVAVFNQMLADQGGRCAICRTDTPGGVSSNFHVDHCHDTGAVRALLCMACNTGIGKLQHNPDLLIKAAEYIQHHRELQDAA